MSCTICQHPKRQEIDRALAAGSATLAALSQAYGLSTSALHRHQAHLQAKMTRAGKRLQSNFLLTCYFWLSQALDLTMETAGAARAEGNYKLLLQAVSQGTRLINLILKQELPLEDQVVYAILTSPHWPAQAAFLPDDPNIMPKIRESLAAGFSTPCPAGPPPSAISVPPDDPDRTALQAAVSNSAPAPSISANRKLKTANRVPKKWEKGGKSAGNDGYAIDKKQQKQLVELEQKISQLDWPALIRGLPPDSARAPEKAILDQLRDSIPIPKDKPLSEYLHERSLLENREVTRPLHS
jgi:hypothetical protein